MNPQTLLEELEELIESHENLVVDNQFYKEFIQDNDLGEKYQDYCREKGVIK